MTIQRYKTKDKVVDLKAIKAKTKHYTKCNYYVVIYQTSKGALVQITFNLLAKAKELIASILGLPVDQLNEYKTRWA
jgi:hypothetical protein